MTASRLSEQKDVTVLLLERGQVLNTWISRVPLLSSDIRLPTAPAYKWVAEPLKGFGELSLNMVAGRVLGGTSKINGHLYTRSVPAEYNAWRAAGREGWAWEDVEPFFNKSETSLSHGKSDHRGSEGAYRSEGILCS